MGLFGRAKSQPAGLPPAAWHPDPGNPAQLRYWDGFAWTAHIAPAQPPPAPQPLTTAAALAPLPSPMVVTEPVTTSQSLGSNVYPSVGEMVGRLRLEAARHPLDEQVEVVGETFHVKGIKKVFREQGRPITSSGSTLEEVTCILVPEPWNPHDVNAVAALSEVDRDRLPLRSALVTGQSVDLLVFIHKHIFLHQRTNG